MEASSNIYYHIDAETEIDIRRTEEAGPVIRVRVGIYPTQLHIFMHPDAADALMMELSMLGVGKDEIRSHYDR